VIFGTVFVEYDTYELRTASSPPISSPSSTNTDCTFVTPTKPGPTPPNRLQERIRGCILSGGAGRRGIFFPFFFSKIKDGLGLDFIKSKSNFLEIWKPRSASCDSCLLRFSLGALKLFWSCESTAHPNSEDMDPKLTEVSQLFDRFKASFLRNDYDNCSNLLSQLKVFLIQPNPSLLIALNSKIRSSFKFFLLFEDRFCCFLCFSSIYFVLSLAVEVSKLWNGVCCFSWDHYSNEHSG